MDREEKNQREADMARVAEDEYDSDDGEDPYWTSTTTTARATSLQRTWTGQVVLLFGFKLANHVCRLDHTSKTHPNPVEHIHKVELESCVQNAQFIGSRNNIMRDARIDAIAHPTNIECWEVVFAVQAEYHDPSSWVSRHIENYQ
jgi:hypothetical protein